MIPSVTIIHGASIAERPQYPSQCNTGHRGAMACTQSDWLYLWEYIVMLHCILSMTENLLPCIYHVSHHIPYRWWQRVAMSDQPVR
ncbi:hypothetical protein GDO81_024650 [Engystomops pustulosus]|uniref:Uncharacterized protein n=1 Tax=Engystomops pustulosus TaxID=76066 RepID=A0AAV6ZMD8_ENGPU|nr:hypothetical protein GDO81_024650 [Engystomops pustulosus]